MAVTIWFTFHWWQIIYVLFWYSMLLRFQWSSYNVLYKVLNHLHWKCHRIISLIRVVDIHLNVVGVIHIDAREIERHTLTLTALYVRLHWLAIWAHCECLNLWLISAASIAVSNWLSITNRLPTRRVLHTATESLLRHWHLHWNKAHHAKWVIFIFHTSILCLILLFV